MPDISTLQEEREIALGLYLQGAAWLHWQFQVAKDGQCIHMRRCFHSFLLSSDMF